MDHEILHGGEDSLKDEQPDKNSCHGEVVAAKKIEILLGAGFAHEKHDGGAAIEWGEREKVKGAEKQVQGEDSEESGEEKTGSSVGWRWNRSMARPARRAKAPRNMRVKLAAGPASAIQAERLG